MNNVVLNEREAKQISRPRLYLEAVKTSPIFTQLFEEVPSPSQGVLSGKRVSIKATFDVQGYTTTGGGQLLGRQSASEDAKAVQLLKEAGAQCVGHTNMTELAYSGLGLNPHFGTPENPLVKGAIPGGSTSGGAVSVAKGYADIALGTDTGGSLRIPAAFCGLTGYKPSQSSVSRIGCLPLSDSLDSVGPIAKSVADCRLAWEVLSEQTASSDMKCTEQAKHADFLIPLNFGFDDIDPQIQTLFDKAVAKIEAAGYRVIHQHVDLFEQYKQLPVWHFSSVESRKHYADYFDLNSDQLDPRVRSRIQRGLEVSDDEFEQTCAARQALIAEYERVYSNTIILLPTVACQAPLFSVVEQDSEYDRINLLCLRNTSLSNVLNGCSISLPYNYGEVIGGIMLNMVNGADEQLLSYSKDIEALFLRNSDTLP
ncbi:hypothetical protein KDD30_10690 [Photobacterium sp. GJ3]|uniref:amidase family protein n=1 Tax=Photobacterium sp. GJ3 TaxID=2829502 RepID=UPI001B8D2E38|nr:amidase family protein [Photobacterium sp. GJ3]QUJ66628.1 hypothetical protein KDD30_10690 [Photobacterium sp. GJ3]